MRLCSPGQTQGREGPDEIERNLQSERKNRKECEQSELADCGAVSDRERDCVCSDHSLWNTNNCGKGFAACRAEVVGVRYLPTAVGTWLQRSQHELYAIKQCRGNLTSKGFGLRGAFLRWNPLFEPTQGLPLQALLESRPGALFRMKQTRNWLARTNSRLRFRFPVGMPSNASQTNGVDVSSWNNAIAGRSLPVALNARLNPLPITCQAVV